MNERLRIAVLISGGGTNLQAIIDATVSGRIRNTEIAAVISNNAGAYGLTRARENGIEAVCISPKDYGNRDLYYDALIEAINSYDVRLVVLAGCMVVIPGKVLDAVGCPFMNVHPALIPSFCGTGYYGLEVHRKALERGVKVTGATVHFVDYGTDTGPIILQKAVEVKDGDTPEELQQRVMREAEWILLPKAIDLFAQGRLRIVDGRVYTDE